MHDMAHALLLVGVMAGVTVLLRFLPFLVFSRSTPKFVLYLGEGLPYEAALQAITLVPARICGIDDRVGSITPGKEADLVLFREDPLTVAAKPAAVMIGGKWILREE